MMRLIGETFNGTGAAVYLGLGFVPVQFDLTSVADTDVAKLHWDVGHRAVISVGGVLQHTAGTQVLYTETTGVIPYNGGDVLTAALQTSVGYGEGVYLIKDDKDYKGSSTAANNAGDGSGAEITTWTLDTTANRTGHFDADVVGTYIGIGSRVTVGDLYSSQNDITATVMVLAAGQGISADEVEFDRAVPSGIVKRITGKYSFKPAPLGTIMPKGVYINITAVANVNDEMQSFIALGE